jgi:hypothetical protein
VWGQLEERGVLDTEEIETLFGAHADRQALSSLFSRGLAFRNPDSGSVHALSRLVRHLL